MAKVSKRQRRVGTDDNGQPIYRVEGWRVRYVDPDGRERSSKTFRLKQEADDFALEVEHRKRTGSYVDPSLGRITFKAYADQWRTSRPHRSSTAEQIESRLRLHVYPFIGQRPLAAIRPTELQALITDRAEALAPASLENIAVWIRTIFRAAVEDHIIARSPATKLTLPAVGAAAPVVPFELDEVDALAAALPVRLRATVALGAGAGLRSGEVLGLTVDRVDFLRRTLTIDRQLVTPQGGPPRLAPPKTKASRRVIPLPDVVAEALAAHMAAFPPATVEIVDSTTRSDTPVTTQLLFTTAAGEPLRRNRWGEIWARAVEAAGQAKGTRFHRLRHTYASLLIRDGCSVKVVQARLGHATAQETMDTYAHMWPDDDDRTRAAIDKAFRNRSDHDRTTGASEA